MEQIPASAGNMPVKVIDLCSDDEDKIENKNSIKKFQQIQNRIGWVGLNQGTKVASQKPPNLEEVLSPLSSVIQNFSRNTKANLFHQFWKAGDYDVDDTQRKVLPAHMHHVRVHPKFLHSNATSHKWAFGAIAELLDNAVDEIPNGASFVILDKIEIPNSSPALLFQDDGGGMDPDCMRRCMSLGYSTKNNKTTIGQYGNGFKTSTMRLGADVIVFSRSAHCSFPTESIGLLSYTYLRLTGQEDTIVPMVDFELHPDMGNPTMLIRSTKEDWLKNLNTILQWSPYKTHNELMDQFGDIGPHGTKIIIFNLWLNEDGILELDFDSDKEDIRLRDGGRTEKTISSQKGELLRSSISYCLRYSLRVYVSILYLRKEPNFQIILRGKPVEHHNIADDLKLPKLLTYRPQLGIGSKEVAITIGFAPEAPAVNIHGFNVYHKNRLIMPYWTIWPSNTDSRGRGVVGVFEANFIEPAHDKQEFEKTSTLLRLEARLRQMTADYWRSHCEFIGYKPKKKSSTKLQQNSSLSSPVENFHSANVVPRGSICRNVVSHVMHVSKYPITHDEVTERIMAASADNNKHPWQTTNTVSCGRSDVCHIGEMLGSKEELDGQSQGTTSSNLVEEKLNSKLLSATVAVDHHTQPNEFRQDTSIFVPKFDLVPDCGLNYTHGNENKTSAFNQGLDSTNSSPSTAKRKVPPLCGTLEEQIAAVWSQIKKFKDREDKNPQVTPVFLPGKFVEKVTKRNIQLIMRCEEYRNRKTQLNQVIISLENELRIARKKFAQVESTMEAQKKHKAECLRIKEETSY